VGGSSARRAYEALASIGVMAAGGFAAAIVTGYASGFVLHEAAGVVLLVLLAAALYLALRLRTEQPQLLGRSLLALVLLIAMGAAGASLGLGVLPGSYDVLPLVLLVGLIASMVEMVRVARVSSPAVARATQLEPAP
jgi:hypothetical protein